MRNIYLKMSSKYSRLLRCFLNSSLIRYIFVLLSVTLNTCFLTSFCHMWNFLRNCTGSKECNKIIPRPGYSIYFIHTASVFVWLLIYNTMSYYSVISWCCVREIYASKRYRLRLNIYGKHLLQHYVQTIWF